MIKEFIENSVRSVTALGTFWHKGAKLRILHRENGHAIEYSNGTKEWYVNGELHRIDGPAVEGFDGFKAWWLNDYQMDFEDWKIVVRRYYDTDEDYLLMLLKLD